MEGSQREVVGVFGISVAVVTTTDVGVSFTVSVVVAVPDGVSFFLTLTDVGVSSWLLPFAFALFFLAILLIFFMEL